MKTSPRVLTIEDFNPHGRFARVSRASLPRLKGCWLKEAGFHSGGQVMVINSSPGVIELRVCNPVPIDVTYAKAIQQLEAVLNESPKPVKGARISLGGQAQKGDSVGRPFS